MKNKGIRLSAVDPSIAYRLFYPQVPLIVCAKFEGKVAAMAANSCIPISNDPAMVALSVFRNSRTNYIVSRAKRFSINWINYQNVKLRGAILDLGTSFSENVVDKLLAADVDYVLEEGIPVINESDAFELCHVKTRYHEGDHDLFVASVVGARATIDFEKYWRFRGYKPVLYLGSNRRKKDQLRSF